MSGSREESDRETPTHVFVFLLGCEEAVANSLCVMDISRSRLGPTVTDCFYGSRAGWETRSQKPESTPPRGTGGRDGPDPARLVE